MASGGIFEILANDGSADSLILATQLLNSRLAQIMCQRKEQGLTPETPSIADVQKTHILFVNAQYKPYASFGYEYTKVMPSSAPAFNSNVQFSIPAYGDFFTDTVIQTDIGPASCNTIAVPAFPAHPQPPVSTSQTLSTSIVGNAQITTLAPTSTATFPYTVTTYTQEYVDCSGTVIAPGAVTQNYTRYVEYPGELLFQKVSFEINGSPLDSYEYYNTIFYRKFWVSKDKILAWSRLVGQETPVTGTTDLISINGYSKFGPDITGLQDSSGNPAFGAPVTATVNSRKEVNILMGPQTPQLTQPALELWIPILLWFSTDVRLAIPSVSIPYGQRFLNITIASANQILQPAPGNLYLRLTVQTVTHNSTGATTAVDNVTNVQTSVAVEPVLLDGSIPGTPTLTLQMWCNNIFMNPEIHDIYLSRVGFNLIRVHRIQKNMGITSSSNITCTSLKWPTEWIQIALQPVANVTNSSTINPTYYKTWHQFAAVTDQIIDIPAQGTGLVEQQYIGASTSSAIAQYPLNMTSTQSVERISIPLYTPTITTVSLEIQGTSIIQTMNTPFFRDYVPWHYGTDGLNAPNDLGAVFMNFALYPGRYQPSGYINISRVHEFIINLGSSYIANGTPCNFIACASSMNFLLIADGSAVLRFTS